MTVKDIVEHLDLAVYAGEAGLNREVEGGYMSDLLSDVMGNAKENQIWLTLQSHKNALAVASLKDLAGIILVKNYKPEQDTIAQANEENMPVLGTEMDAFALAGKLYNFLNK